MENKSFEIIVKRVGSVLEGKGFKKRNSNFNSKEINEAIFTGQNGSIKVSFNSLKKRVELFVSTDLDVHDQTIWSLNSSWLFDPEVDGEKEAISISNDFIDMLNEGARKKVVQKKRKKEDDSNVDPHFFINRLVNFFPYIKADVEAERREYASFRYVTFIKEKVVGEINRLFSGQDNVKIKRFCKLLSDAYENGDKDVRSIVTIIILNSVESEREKNKVMELISDELKKAWVAADKFKYKKVKPEKVKTKKTLMSKMLQESASQ